MLELGVGASDYTPPNIIHWHGAAADQALVQINAGFGGAAKWFEEVTADEYAGVVDWVGPEAGPDLRPGDEVLVDGFLAGPRSLGAYQAYGGFASYAVAPAEAVRRIPGNDNQQMPLFSMTYAYGISLAEGPTETLTS